MDDNKRIGLFIRDDLLNLCDRNVGRDESSSRSEFVCNAIEFYIAWLNKEMEGYFLSPELESVISSKIKDTENRLSRVFFKQERIDINVVDRYADTYYLRHESCRS